MNETQVSFFVLQIYNDKIKFQGPKGFCKAGIFSEQGMSLHSRWHSNYPTDSVSYQGRKYHIPVFSSITLLYGTSMQKMWKWSSDLLLGKKQREACVLRAEQGFWHCTSWGASEMCWKHYNLKGPDARMQGSSDVCVVLLSYTAHNADGLVCWRGSFWLWVCVASVLPGPQAVCMHPRLALGVPALVASKVATAPPGLCVHHVHYILQPLAP